MGIISLFATSFASAQLVGNDADKHGCTPSTGSSYSVLKKECVQPFNLDIKMTQVGTEAWSAGAIVSDNKKKSEVFAKDFNGKSLILKGNGKSDVWKSGEYELSKTTAGYELKKADAVIYK